MALRESNPYHLEILTQAAAQGVPMEVDVFDGSDPGTLLDTLDGATDAAFTDVLNDVGGGQCRLSRYDPKATPTNLAKGNLVKIKTGGVYRYSWWIEEMELTTASDDEKGGEYWQVSGRGAIAYLDRAVMYNRSYIGTTDVARLVPLTTDLVGAHVADDKTLAVTAGEGSRFAVGASIAFGPGGDDGSDDITAVAANVITIENGLDEAAASGLDIVQAQYPAGSTYFQLTNVVGLAVGDYVRLGGADDFVKITAILSGNVVKTTKSAQDHTGTAAVEDNSEYVVLGNGPHEGQWAWHNEPLGSILRRAVLEQQEKSPTPFNFLTLNFSNTADSQGALWPDVATVTVDVGTNLLDVWKLCTGLGMDSRMRHDLRLEAYVELGRHLDVTDGTGEVVFRTGKHIKSELKRVHRALGEKSRMLVKGTDDTYFEVLRGGGVETDLAFGRREGFMSFGNSDDPTTVQAAATAELRAQALDAQGITFDVAHGLGPGEYEPYEQYRLGDWVTVHEPGVYDLTTARIVGISLQQNEDGYGVTLECNSVQYDDLTRLARKAAREGGDSNASAGGSGGGTSGAAGTVGAGKVAVEAGDSLNYLNSKIVAGTGIQKSLTGAVPNRKVRITRAPMRLDDLTDVNLATPPDAGNALVYDGDLWVPGAGGGGGGGGGGGFLSSAKATPHAADDEFIASSLNAKWTAVAGAAGVVDPLRATIQNVYDLLTRPGTLLLQGTVKLRQDFTLPVGSSVVMAVSGNPANTGDNMRMGFALNTNDANPETGPAMFFYIEQDTTGWEAQGTVIAPATGGSTLSEEVLGGQQIFIRATRNTATLYQMWISKDGHTWAYVCQMTSATELTNLWIDTQPPTSYTFLPVVAVPWIRIGSNALDPWAWTTGAGAEPHPDLPQHDALGLATQAELDAHAATSHGGTHPDLATHDGLGLATDADLTAHAATPHGGGGGGGGLFVGLHLIGAHGGATIPVDSTAYVSRNALTFYMDFGFAAWTHFALGGFMRSTIAATAITLEVREQTANVRLSTAGNDFVVANSTLAFYESGWTAIATPPTGLARLEIRLKGANSTVDFVAESLHRSFKS